MSWINEVDFVVDWQPAVKRGHRGADVVEIQRLLRGLGFRVTVDGIFGPATERAVSEFQKANHLVVDGRVGPKTLETLHSTKPNTKYLTHQDLVEAAQKLRVPVAAVMAVNEVESRGSGFFSNGRPAILYERHIMRRRLLHYGVNPEPHISRSPNLVNTSTGGYSGGVAEYDRLSKAERIHKQAALESASWGLFQIMGFHWKHLGYRSVEDYVEHMHQSEGAQLQAFVEFNLRDATLLRALRSQDWTTYARTYNGPGYASRPPGYHVLLKNAFDRYSESVRTLALTQ